LQARKKVCEYLTQEGFDTQLRFSGRCDWFKEGGRWSGQLSRLRLVYEQPKQWETFCNRTRTITGEEAKPIFREMFPTFRGEAPFGRESSGKLYGRPDDAQIMDEPLFQRLKKGFSEEVTPPIEDKGPNVIFTTDEYVQAPDGDFPWPKTGTEGERWWVVIIDYHW
jgi:hypothetical protein